MSDLTEQQQAQAALDKVMNSRFSNFDAGAVIHWVERGMYQVKPDQVSQPDWSRALDDLLYHLEPFLAAAAVVIERPDQYQPAVARIGGISNARDLRVEDFQRLVNARAALSRFDAVEEIQGYCTDCENNVTTVNGRCPCGSGRVITHPSDNLQSGE